MPIIWNPEAVDELQELPAAQQPRARAIVNAWIVNNQAGWEVGQTRDRRIPFTGGGHSYNLDTEMQRSLDGADYTVESLKIVPAAHGATSNRAPAKKSTRTAARKNRKTAEPKTAKSRTAKKAAGARKKTKRRTVAARKKN